MRDNMKEFINGEIFPLLIACVFVLVLGACIHNICPQRKEYIPIEWVTEYEIVDNGIKNIFKVVTKHKLELSSDDGVIQLGYAFEYVALSRGSIRIIKQTKRKTL